MGNSISQQHFEYLQQEAYNNHMEESREPEVVPCYKCGCQMYEEDNDPRLNICDECKEVKDGK